MPSLTKHLVKTAGEVRGFLDADSRRAIIRFIQSRWNADGGVRGRDEKSDLYYTVFAAICMRVLRGPVPMFRLWRFVRTFGDGSSLDMIHFFCFVRLRSVFPMSRRFRSRLVQTLDGLQPESAYDMFFQVVMSEYLGEMRSSSEALNINAGSPTTNVAAAIVVNGRVDVEAEQTLMTRYSLAGGFCAAEGLTEPDLLSTATALFALRVMEVDLEPIRERCMKFVESLWRESGGFAGHHNDQFEDVEYTYYALLSLGCLME